MLAQTVDHYLSRLDQCLLMELMHLRVLLQQMAEQRLFLFPTAHRFQGLFAILGQNLDVVTIFFIHVPLDFRT